METAERHHLTEVTPQGKLRFHLHAGQWRAMDSRKRIVLVLAGTQGGKTEFGAPWLMNEIRAKGPGDYLVASPTYPLLAKKCLPVFLRLFRQQLRLGDYNTQSKVFTFSPAGQRRLHGKDFSTPTAVHFGHAQDPDSLESMTAKAAWLDEAGQKKFRLGSWEAVRRRLAIHRGRVLITTTPYDLGWLKQQLWDRWVAAGKDHPEIEVVHFRSIENPAFPREEYYSARATMPAWRFSLFYDAVFSRPAGVIYDNWDESAHVVRRFRIPQEWPRFVGLDFGPVNTAAVFLAQEIAPSDGRPTGRYFVYREYHPGTKRTEAQHVQAILTGEPRLPSCTGGSHSEDEWRAEFARAGLSVMEPPIREVEVGIDRVYAMIARGQILAFDDCAKFREQMGTYSRELDDAGNVTEKIEDPHSFHVADALRYICARLHNKLARGAWKMESF